MNILVLCLSRGYGGLELYAAQEVMQWQQRGFNCLAVVAGGSMLDEYMRQQQVNALQLRVTNRRLPLLAAYRLAQLIDEHNIDLLHIHWNKDLNLAVLAKKFSRRPVRLVYSRHMAITRSKRDPLHRWFYNAVDRLIVLTCRLQLEAEQFLPLRPSQISQLYIGVKDVDDSPADYTGCYSDTFPRRKFNVALFGRIEPYKGQHLLISATQELVEKGMDISATIVGHVMDKEYFDVLQKTVRQAGLTQHIQFESFINNPAQRMKCYDAVVLTTECETFGLVLLEAMRAGVAVVGTRCGGVPEIIDDNETGLLFTPGSETELADSIARLYQSPALVKELAHKGRDKADQQFSETKHFEKLQEILEKECEY